MIRLVLLLICIPLISFSQVYDDFNDGDFTSNPEWNGTTSKFIVNDNFQLQLNDTAAGKAYLYTSNTMANNCEWRFWVKQSFSPSSNNNGRIYLISDNQDLTGDLHGYFIQLGESGSNDAVELFRQDGNETTSVCRGTDGLIASSFSLGFKVTRDENGLWNIYIDKENNGIYLPEASGTDNTYTQTSYFGIYAKYTVSNSKKFYWDDIYAGEIIVDNQPPEVENILVLSDSSLLIRFSEAVDEVTAQNVNNYLVNNNIGNPLSIETDAVDVTLFFSNKFQNNTVYTITVKNITDLAENVMQEYQTQFSYYTANKADVVFNEIFPDPNPSVGLPPFEFIELFNRTDNVISLNNWTLTIGTSEKTFENININPKGFLIVGKIDAGEEYSQYGTFYGFESFSLTNSGQTLMLTNQNGDLINKIAYKKSWYKDPDKEDGGWTLEQINPDNICSGEENWAASVNSKGGTPGAVNSIFSDMFLYPSLKDYSLTGNDVIELVFNQDMDKKSLSDINNYFIDNGIGNPSGAYPDINDNSKVGLFFENPLENGKNYKLTISKNIKNCIGVKMKNDTVIQLGIPEIIEPGDIVINEILFNPLTGGEDYVEIYNRSDKLLDISQLEIGTVKISPPNPPDTLWYDITDKQHLFFSGDYLVFTKSPDAVKSQYIIKNPDAFIEVNPFPAYNNEEGTVLFKTDSAIIDAFTYNENMQYPLLQYVDGVALERINPEGKTNDKNNWHSAAESAGFGTPGYVNSQYFQENTNVEDITVEPEVFSPDNDGKDDLLNIIYNFAEPGNSLSVIIYNKNGKAVRSLIENEYVGTKGMITWDGVTDDNVKAPVGIYIIYIKSLNSNGTVKAWKKTAVLSTKW